MRKVAVYTIAKNEEQFVERWYNSTKEADYHLILDTGSNDDTVQIARSLGINVVEKAIDPWRFDDARNAALAELPDDIDFCLSLDMDEIMLPGWYDGVQGLPEGTTRVAYRFVWNWTEEGEEGIVFNIEKIHARHGYEWRHPVHEVLYCIGREVKVVSDKIHSEHHADNSKPRSQYLPLLELAVQEDPTDARNAFYYARELYFCAKYSEALTEFRRFLALPAATWAPERAAGYRYMAKCDPQNAVRWLLMACGEAPNRREPWVDLALAYYVQQNWTATLMAANQALQIKERPLEYLTEANAWGSAPHDLCAIAAYNMGLFSEAYEQGLIAMQLNPGDPRLRSNLIFYSDAMINPVD